MRPPRGLLQTGGYTPFQPFWLLTLILLCFTQAIIVWAVTVMRSPRGLLQTGGTTFPFTSTTAAVANLVWFMSALQDAHNTRGMRPQHCWTHRKVFDSIQIATLNRPSSTSTVPTMPALLNKAFYYSNTGATCWNRKLHVEHHAFLCGGSPYFTHLPFHSSEKIDYVTTTLSRHSLRLFFTDSISYYSLQPSHHTLP